MTACGACNDRLQSTGEAEPAKHVDTLQVTGDLKFFCNWKSHEDGLLIAKADYDIGNRRFSDAWTLLDKKDVPYTEPTKQAMCWEGALLYIGVFGARTELPALLTFADKDWMVENETTDPAQSGGMTELGEMRSDVHRVVYIALAAQVRRQLLFDGVLDTQAHTSASVLEDCAGDHDKCIPATAMHTYRKQRHQRHAVRGLALSGSTSNWTLFSGLENQLPSLHFLLPYAVSEAKRMRMAIDQNNSWILASVPAP
jgi:hypothetical protein